MQSIPIKNVGESRLVDPFQRQYYYLRLSITDQCNFRCTYCLPDGYQPEANKPSFLTLKEITHLAQAFAEMGTEKIRLTVVNRLYAKILFLLLKALLILMESVN